MAVDWVSDPVRRSANVDRLYQIIADTAPSRTNAEWLALLKDADIPCGPVNALEDLFRELHLSAAGLFEGIVHPSEGPLTAIRSPFRIAGVAPKPDRPAPRVGEGTESVLREAGFDDEEVNTLVEKKIVRLA